MVQYVRSCVAEQRFVVTDHAQRGHTLAEGFTVRQGIEALMGGELIEDYSGRQGNVDRLLFCGTASGLKLDTTRFFTTYIHVVVEVEEATQIVVVTMYRPDVNRWRNPWKRV